MYRNFALVFVVSLALSLVAASEPIPTQSTTIAILPEDCKMPVGGELLLELSGPLPSDAVVHWDVDYGEVAFLLPGSSAVLVAPAAPGVMSVYVTITGTAPGRWIYITRQCIVFEPEILDG